MRRPLQQPYDGTYRVLSRIGKRYVLDINGMEDTVSIDCLKPTYLESTSLHTFRHTPPFPLHRTLSQTFTYQFVHEEPSLGLLPLRNKVTWGVL